MIDLTIEEITRSAGGEWLGDPALLSARPADVVTDSRDAGRGSLFIAIRGERTDGHRYIPRMKVFDCYRPQCAVKHFVMWGIEDNDIRMKEYFYPDLVKQELFSKGYVASKSSHSRGSTIDLTLLDMKTGKEVDMGSPFDMFSEVSHPDYRGITDEQYNNRMILRNCMLRNGFEPIDCEWWHFTLKDEPYPDTYFEFPVSAEYLLKGR